jgi:hypothetical protein
VVEVVEHLPSRGEATSSKLEYDKKVYANGSEEEYDQMKPRRRHNMDSHFS